jgi:Icc protein
MPIYLPPISRRRFLAGTIAALASGRLRSPFAFAADSDPNVIALLADTHIAVDRAKRQNDVNMADNLTRVVKELIEAPQRPATAFVVGDLALKDGQSRDYGTLGDLLKPARESGLPLLLTLGNHDHRDRFLKEFNAKGERPAGGRIAEVVALPRANLFLLDTLDVTDKAAGLVGEAQLAWLAKALDARPDKPAIVLGHHDPMFEPPPPGKEPGKLVDTADLLKVLTPRKQVKAFVFGHSHAWSVKEHASGIHLINLPPTAYVFTPGMPAGWVHGTLAPDGAKLKLSCLDKTHKAHGQVVDLKWRT